MAWFGTSDQSFVEDHLRGQQQREKEVSRNFSVDYFGILVGATAESKYQLCVSFFHVIHDQDLFDSKVQSIVEYAQISDA